MPIYEYACRACGKEFEALVYGPETPGCPSCGQHDLQKRFSAFAVGGSSGVPTAEPDGGACGTCGDPRGPGACDLN